MSMNISRRSFMKGAAAASLAVAASTMLTGCDMPSFDFGGIFGNRTKTITVAEGETINIALTSYQVDSVCKEYVPEFKVVNNTQAAVKFAKEKPSSGQSYYTVVATLDYVGTTGGNQYINATKNSLLNAEIASGENKTDKLYLNMFGVDDWTGIKLTFTAYNYLNEIAGEPVVFTFEK